MVDICDRRKVRCQASDERGGKLLLRLSEWAVRFLLPIASFVALVSGTFAGTDFAGLAARHPGSSSLYLFVGGWVFPVFVASALVGTALAVLQSFISPHIKKHEQRADDLQGQVDLVATNLRAVFDALMLQVSTALNVEKGDDVRVSIYTHDGAGHFLLCGRYSPNPEYRKTGRPSYPDNEGCIGKGWANGWWFDDCIGLDTRSYNKKTREVYGISSEELKKIKMRSKFFAVHRIDDPNAQPLGVIVLESLAQQKFAEKDAKRKLSEASRINGPLVSAFKSYVPDPRVARAKGF